ncbi:MAG: hypothetical protein ACRDNB_09055 [Gaiellaceae bacterium]
MPLLWLSLAVAIVSVIASSIYLTLKGLEAFRAVKALGRTITGELERVEEAAAGIERHLALAAESTTRLDAELAQLRGSQAKLNVLTSAIADVRAAVGRVTGVYPRK